VLFCCAAAAAQVYQNELERFVVEHAGVHYKRASSGWKEEYSCPDYLEKAEKLLHAERDRVESYLNRVSLDALHKECYVQLLKTHQADLLKKNTGLRSLLTQNARPGKQKKPRVSIFGSCLFFFRHWRAHLRRFRFGSTVPAVQEVSRGSCSDR
jgi:glycogen synthase